MTHIYNEKNTSTGLGLLGTPDIEQQPPLIPDPDLPPLLPQLALEIFSLVLVLVAVADVGLGAHPRQVTQDQGGHLMPVHAARIETFAELLDIQPSARYDAASRTRDEIQLGTRDQDQDHDRDRGLTGMPVDDRQRGTIQLGQTLQDDVFPPTLQILDHLDPRVFHSLEYVLVMDLVAQSPRSGSLASGLFLLPDIRPRRALVALLRYPPSLEDRSDVHQRVRTSVLLDLAKHRQLGRMPGKGGDDVVLVEQFRVGLIRRVCLFRRVPSEQTGVDDDGM